MPEERKLVSILFADVTGSTALGESLELEDFRALMARYYAHAQRIVKSHGGALEKFIGDAVVAVFGLLQAHSNDAERALASALALREAVDGDSVLGGRLTLRMGVNTGPVITTITGDAHRGDFLVTGDAVNVASRLEQHASPGEILASERTAQAAEASFVFGPARSIAVKGKSHPLRVYPLSAARPARQMGRPPLVGRKRELAQLAARSARTLAERTPEMVAIVAPAGAGKTRLIEEFTRRLNPADGFRVAMARCQPYGQTLTYWPLRGLLDELLGEPFTLDAVAGVFAADGYSAADAQRLAALALTALGVESEGQVEREALFNTWRMLIEALARQAPRVIVFEDLHWASESLLDLVERLIRPGANAPLLVAVTCRPALLEHRAGWGGDQRGVSRMALQPLSAPDTRALVGKLAKKTPATTRALIAERSGGNPFFAIELTRGLNGDGGVDAMPDTVQEAVQERLDTLAPRERAVLQVAAVAGRAFRPATLRAAMADERVAVADGGDGGAGDERPLTGGDVETALDSLLARDLITPVEDGSYAFRHVLIRDVTYGALSRAERIRLHLVVARWLEDFAAGRLDEFIELIAYHYAQAAELDRQSAIPLEATVDVARAVRYLERAASLAFQAGALIEARGHLERALALALETDHHRLYEALGDQSGMLSDVAVPAYRAALGLWRGQAGADPLTGARVMRKLALHIMRWHGGMTPDDDQRAEMAGWRTDARRLAERAGDNYEQWRLRAADLFWFWWTGDPPTNGAPALLAAGWEAADYFEERGDLEAFSEALDGYGTLAFMMGDWEATFAASRRRLAAPALPLYERIDALNTVVWSQSDRGDYAGAITTVREMLAQRRPGEVATAFASAVFSAREDACWSGAWDEFNRLSATLDEIWEETGRRPEDPRLIRLWQGDCIHALVVAQAREDRAAVSRVTGRLSQLASQDSREARRRAFHGWIEAIVRDDSAPLRALLGEVETSEDLDLLPSYTTMCRFLSERGLPVPERVLELVADGRMVRTVDSVKRWHAIARALADGDDAALAAAVDAAEAHGVVPHAMRMRVVLAQRTSDRAHLERARPALERMGDRLFLRRLDAVAASLGA